MNKKHTITNNRGPSENKEVYRIFFSIDVNWCKNSRRPMFITVLFYNRQDLEVI